MKDNAKIQQPSYNNVIHKLGQIEYIKYDNLYNYFK